MISLKFVSVSGNKVFIWLSWHMNIGKGIQNHWYGLCPSSGILNNSITQRFGNWNCFLLQMSRARDLLCWVSYKGLTWITWITVHKGHSRVGESLPSPEEGNSSSFRSVAFTSCLEFRTMDKPESCGFEIRWGWMKFFNVPNPSGRTRSWGLLSL
jgi:hypothetical protein